VEAAVALEEAQVVAWVAMEVAREAEAVNVNTKINKRIRTNAESENPDANKEQLWENPPKL